LTALLSFSSIAVSQHISTDSICFSQDQAKKIMKDLKRLDYCDSITQNQQLQISNFKDVINKDSILLQLKDERMAELQKSLSINEKKLKLSVALNKFGIPISFGVGAVLILLLK